MNSSFSFTIFTLLIKRCDIFLERINRDDKFGINNGIIFTIDKFKLLMRFLPEC